MNRYISADLGKFYDSSLPWWIPGRRIRIKDFLTPQFIDRLEDLTQQLNDRGLSRLLEWFNSKSPMHLIDEYFNLLAKGHDIFNVDQTWKTISKNSGWTGELIEVSAYADLRNYCKLKKTLRDLEPDLYRKFMNDVAYLENLRRIEGEEMRPEEDEEDSGEDDVDRKDEGYWIIYPHVMKIYRQKYDPDFTALNRCERSIKRKEQLMYQVFKDFVTHLVPE